tara:strand:- start:49 stop:399 length:351 start_codon:yes stop_codon:yes gene_type:complete
MEVQGKIKILGETETFGTDFTKRQLVVTTDEQYPQLISVDFLKDKCDLLNTYKVGDSVKVSINLGGREWINPQGVAKYFNSITGWRIEKVDNAPNVPQPPLQQMAQAPTEPADLPF